MSTLLTQIPADWRVFLSPADGQHLEQIKRFLDQEQQESEIYPPQSQLFQALEYVAPAAVKVVILGQDPYHGAGQAHGLAFSVQPGTQIPPSLKNIYKELQADLGCQIPEHGYLVDWAKQGVLLLNAMLSVRAQAAGSHQKIGWETITNAFISGLSSQAEHLVFVLWGSFAHKKAALIDARHTIIQSVHPSPLSAHRGFLGSRPFSKINTALLAHQQEAIDWCLKESKNV